MGKTNILNTLALLIAANCILPRKLEFIGIWIIIFLSILFFSVERIKLKNIIILFSIVAIHGLVTITLNNYEYSKFFQQFLLLLVTIIGYSLLFNIKGISRELLFFSYLKIALISSVFTVIQFFLFKVAGISILMSYGASDRFSSFFGEAGYLIQFLIPATCYYLSKIIDHGIDKDSLICSILLIVSFILAKSSAGIFILTLFVIYKLVRVKYLAYIIPLAFLLYFLLPNIFNYDNTFKEKSYFLKIQETFEGVSSIDPMIFEQLNLSSYATLSNLYVSINAPSRLFGTGLGSHEQNYHKVYPSSNRRHYGLNSEDGYALGNRIFSEFGIIGLILFGFIVFKFYNKNDLISTSLLFFILFVFIRGGHYTINGTIFFFMLYFSREHISNYDFKKITQ
nr:hypothetical protein [uncultured Draconibacterium sp.]